MDQYDEGFQKAAEQLAEGLIDEGIDTWETTFTEAKHHLGVTQWLWRKADYAHALQAVDLDERAWEVDREIEEALERDRVEEREEVTPEDHSALLQNIADRWDLFNGNIAQESMETLETPREEAPSPTSVASDEVDDNTAQNSRTETILTSRPEATSSPPVAIQHVRRTQSFSTATAPKSMADDSTRQKNQSSALEQRIVGDVLFSSYQSPARAVPLALDVKAE